MPVTCVLTDFLDVDPPADLRLVRVPLMAIATVIGIRATQELLVDVCDGGVLVTAPPWDFLDAATAERIRSRGTRIVACTDDTDPPPLADRVVPAATLLVAAALPATPASTPDHDMLLLGELTPRRTALIDRLRAAGVNIIVRQALARTAIVLATEVDRSLVETAMRGVFQIAHESPELRALFTEDEVPGYRDPEDLVERALSFLANEPARQKAADAARARALRDHTFAARWPALVGDLQPTAAQGRRAPLYEQMLLVLGSRAEIDDNPGDGAAYFGELLRHVPDEPTAAAGLGRCLRDLGRSQDALAPLRIAAAAPPPASLARQAMSVPTAPSGSGFGRLGIVPPAAEPICFLLASLVELGREDEALAVAESLNDVALVDAVTQALGGDLPPALKDKLAAKLVSLT